MACIFFLIASMLPQLWIPWVLQWKGLAPDKQKVGYLCRWILQNWGDSKGGEGGGQAGRGQGGKGGGGTMLATRHKRGAAGRVHMGVKLSDTIQISTLKKAKDEQKRDEQQRLFRRKSKCCHLLRLNHWMRIFVYHLISFLFSFICPGSSLHNTVLSTHCTVTSEFGHIRDQSHDWPNDQRHD